MVAFKFETENWDANVPTTQTLTKTGIEPLGDTRFRQLFADKDWHTLPKAVRRRFGRRVAIGDALIYRGKETLTV